MKAKTDKETNLLSKYEFHFGLKTARLSLTELLPKNKVGQSLTIHFSNNNLSKQILAEDRGF